MRSPAVRQGLSVGVATGLYGISFGALATAAGLSVWQACLLSAVMFTGGSQFAVVGVLAAGGAPVAGFASATLLGLRNAVYGLQLAPRLRPRGWRRLLAAHLTIDESAAVSAAQDDADEARWGFWAAGLGVFVCWNATTLGGAVLGDALGDPRRWGLDGAAAAAFLALLWPRLRRRETAAVAAAAALVAVLTLPVAPAGVPVLAAALVAAALGWWRTRPARRDAP
nr:AzlC family ABC transporter permease [Kineococcus siccus]